MGLFDPPAVGIRNRTPSVHLHQFDALADRVHQSFPGLSRTNRGLALGMVMAAWVLGEHRRESLSLSNSDGKYIATSGLNCARLLRSKFDVADALIMQLTEEGVIYEGEV